MSYPCPHTCFKCQGPLSEDNEGQSPHFYQVHCPLCKSIFLAPKTEAADIMLGNPEFTKLLLEHQTPAAKLRRVARNRRKRRAKKLSH